MIKKIINNVEKINIAELLKDYPKGMELYSTMYEDVYFDYVDELNIIHCYIQHENYKTSITFNQYGTYNSDIKSKCVIFPKGENTWDGFVPFVAGDVIYTDNFIAILSHIEENGVVWYHCYYCIHTKNFKAKHDYGIGNINYNEFRLATEEERQKLFQTIKDNGYEWNPETKTLKELPKFKIEKGKWYVCTKDLLDNYANKAFCKGDTYLSTQDGSLIPSNSNVPFEVVCASTYFRDWTINDAKDGDVLATSKGAFIYNGNKGGGSCPGSYCGINTLGRFQTGVEHHWTGKEVYPATKEQSDFLFQKIKEAGYEWNPETKTLKKLPKFKVGDKVIVKGYEKMDEDEVICVFKTYDGDIKYKNLDTHYFMEDNLIKVGESNKEENMRKQIKIVDLNPKLVGERKVKLVIPHDWEIKEENGEIFLQDKRPQYPKDYVECCKVLGISRDDVDIDLPHPYQQKMFNLFKLHICRDAYWKVYGEQMGLGKPWEPDWKDSNFKYCLKKMGDNIEKSSEMTISCILAFPTAEMRDAFSENFKELIEQCKELL